MPGTESGQPRRALESGTIGTKSNEEKWPSVLHAYDLSVQSYDWASKRCDTVESNIDKMLTWVTSINLAVIAIVVQKVQTAPPIDWLFLSAMALFATATALGVIGKLTGYLMLINPKRLFEHCLRLDEWEFKRAIVQNAAKHFEHNRALVNRKAHFHEAATIAFLLEAALLVTWIIRHLG